MKTMNIDQEGGNFSKKKARLFKKDRMIRWVIRFFVLVTLSVIIVFIVVSLFPHIGAIGADWLRDIIGDKAVANLEMIVFHMQDHVQMWKYELGWTAPIFEQFPISTLAATNTLESVPTIHFDPTLTFDSTSITLLQPTVTLEPIPWQPVDVLPMSFAPAEGIWMPYLQDSSGLTVSYKTYVQPDPERPYTLVAIVAFDLSHIRLHYVLGAYEPRLAGSPLRDGTIDPADIRAGDLLAAFNGGFQARHGQFGAMADGYLALPPQEGLGTLIIYRDGNIRLLEWSSQPLMTPDVVAFRQNGPLVIQDGQINPRIYNNSPQDWGYTVNDVSPTVRSAIGLSKDNKTLYYFCGPSLSMEYLGRSMLVAGAYNAIQLDINNYWVLFVKLDRVGAKLTAEPLLPRLMITDIDRYLGHSSRDFFYITSYGE